MTNREELVESLRRQGIQFEETETSVSFRTEHWVIDHYFDAQGNLVGIGQGNLAAVEKLELYGEGKKT